jgi:hypothetical protein
VAEVVKTVSSSPGLNACLARNWWAVGLRGILAVAFGLAVLALPSPTLASLIVWFAAYLAADGIFALLAATWAARRAERSLQLIYEGATNLAVAAGVLAWHVIAIVPFFRLASVWAVVTGRCCSPPRGGSPSRTGTGCLRLPEFCRRLGARWWPRGDRHPRVFRRQRDGGSSAMRCRSRPSSRRSPACCRGDTGNLTSLPSATSSRPIPRATSA